MTVSYGLNNTFITITEAGTTSDDNFIITNTGLNTAAIKFDGGNSSHLLEPSQSMIRAGVNGAVTAKCVGAAINGVEAATTITISGS